ncbi:hypothetical protein L1987_63815 [Smallanthus sonchifolius]|uniref:Uncharacterized protein n=1 Tax=Smallanthus sonchifolius TaxID=185202 RepID=A0ACB9CEA4_9ASTR|nr:hypothetical protein L1987_63815 [Smallanthus sonchifolius]
MQNVKMGKNKLKINIAMFSIDNLEGRGESREVKRPQNIHVEHRPRAAVDDSLYFGGKSYRDAVVKNSSVSREEKVIVLPSNVNACSDLHGGALVGRSSDFTSFRTLNSLLRDARFVGLDVQYIGGLSVLISFGSTEEATELLVKQGDWLPDCLVKLDPPVLEDDSRPDSQPKGISVRPDSQPKGISVENVTGVEAFPGGKIFERVGNKLSGEEGNLPSDSLNSRMWGAPKAFPIMMSSFVKLAARARKVRPKKQPRKDDPFDLDSLLGLDHSEESSPIQANDPSCIITPVPPSGPLDLNDFPHISINSSNIQRVASGVNGVEGHVVSSQARESSNHQA